jgi:hypothetical protein
MASPSMKRDCTDRLSMDDARETVGEIVAVTGIEPHTCFVAPPRHDAKPVVLDFMNPARAGWRLFG